MRRATRPPGASLRGKRCARRSSRALCSKLGSARVNNWHQLDQATCANLQRRRQKLNNKRQPIERRAKPRSRPKAARFTAQLGVTDFASQTTRRFCKGFDGAAGARSGSAAEAAAIARHHRFIVGRPSHRHTHTHTDFARARKLLAGRGGAHQLQFVQLRATPACEKTAR